MDDEEILSELLTTERDSVKLYNLTVLVCTTPLIQENLLSMLCTQHQLCLDLKTEISKRGFLPSKSAEKADIAAVKKQFVCDN